MHAEFGGWVVRHQSHSMSMAVCLQSFQLLYVDAVRKPLIHRENDFTGASAQIIAEGRVPRTAV